MKRCILLMALVTAAVPQLFAQATNVVPARPAGEAKPEQSKASRSDSKEERSTFRTRQLRLMEKALDEIGVTKEQRQQIMVLQLTQP